MPISAFLLTTPVYISWWIILTLLALYLTEIFRQSTVGPRPGLFPSTQLNPNTMFSNPQIYCVEIDMYTYIHVCTNAICLIKIKFKLRNVQCNHHQRKNQEVANILIILFIKQSMTHTSLKCIWLPVDFIKTYGYIFTLHMSGNLL